MSWNPFRHFGLKVTAVILGFVVWFTVSGPRVERTISRVPVIYRNVPASLEISDQTDEANVQVRGVASQVRTLQTGDVVVEVDLANERTGLIVIPLRTDQVTVPLGVEVTRVDPGAVTLTLEQSSTAEVPIRPMIEGFPAPGYIRGQVIVEPPTVAVTGPERRLKATTAAITQRVSIEGATDTVVQTVSVGVIDSELRLAQQRTARVTVKIERGDERRLESVRVTFRRVPQGRRATAVPESVTIIVRGPTSVIGNLNTASIVPYIDLEGLATGEHTLPVQVDPVSNYTVAIAPATVAVRIR